MIAMHAVNPTEVRKAAAFVEKLQALEEEFGYVLQLGDGILLGRRGAKPVFAVAREEARPGSRVDPLMPTPLALGMPTPSTEPAFPINGRD